MSHSEAPAASTPSCHGDSPAAEDSCCETPVQRDYFLWICVLVVAVAYPVGAFIMPHDHQSVIGIFTGGIVELFNQMWWGIAIGVVFVGILGRVPRDLVMGMAHLRVHKEQPRSTSLHKGLLGDELFRQLKIKLAYTHAET